MVLLMVVKSGLFTGGYVWGGYWWVHLGWLLVGMSGMVTEVTETFRLDNLESEVVGEACYEI
jgi:hypothetical protein